MEGGTQDTPLKKTASEFKFEVQKETVATFPGRRMKSAEGVRAGFESYQGLITGSTETYSSVPSIVCKQIDGKTYSRLLNIPSTYALIFL